MPRKVRLYLSIPQFKMLEPALREASLPRTHRLLLDANELKLLLEAWKGRSPKASDHLGKFRTWDVLDTRLRRALLDASTTEEVR